MKIPTPKSNILNLSKAQTLVFLEKKLQHAQVLPSVIVTFSQWKKNKSDILKLIKHTFNQSLVVRSSSLNEDKATSSMAGKYLSLLQIPCESKQTSNAIQRVFDSYISPSSEDQVLIQPMLLNVQSAGVAFSCDPNSAAPYYIISDDNSGSTTSITEGNESTGETWVVKHDSTPPKQLQPVINLLQELQPFYGEHALDIEFAICNNELFLLQVRVLIINTIENLKHEQKTYQLELSCMRKKLQRLQQPHPYLLGDKSIFGVMTDWNPAEIIGIKPKPLALSLYKELVTDSIWAFQRHNYGYRDLRGFPLLTSIGGTPFIDIRISFNSFIPASLPIDCAEKLVNSYLNKLYNTPELHDKVEFDIVASCFSFNLKDKLAELDKELFSPHDLDTINLSLINLTNEIISDDNGVWRKDIKKIETLKNKQAALNKTKLNKIDKIYWLLEDCKRYGTLPFAGLARAGFVAMQLLESMREKKLISESEYHDFMQSVNTVSSNLIKDIEQLPLDDFLDEYGHLRPGTYDITSPRYDKAPEKYFSNKSKKNNVHIKAVDNFSISLKNLNNINSALKIAGITTDAIGLFNFIKKAIEAREYGKFIFSKSLSDSLEIINQLGQQLNLNREELAYADIKDILKLYSTTLSANVTLNNSIAVGKQYHQLCQKIKLPILIKEPTDINAFKLMEGEPNFITNKSITAKTCILKDSEDITGKIVFIESADPGFDWLFSKNIAGLITLYGGCNSHMAIRAGELAIPSIIGAGEHLYNNWKKLTVLHLDCASHKVESIT